MDAEGLLFEDGGVAVHEMGKRSKIFLVKEVDRDLGLSDTFTSVNGYLDCKKRIHPPLP